MSWYNSLSDLTGDVGGVAKKAMPFAGLIPGAGTVVSGIEGLLNLGGGGSQNGGTFNPSSGPSVGVTGDGTNPAINVPTDYGTGNGSSGGGVLQSIEGALKSAGGSAGSFLSGNGGANALGIAQGVNTALQQQKANNYANQAMSSVQDSYNARAPLRAEGIAGLLHPQTPSLAGLDSITNTGNPFAPKTPGATPGIGATPISAAIPQPQFGTPPTMPAMGALS